MCIIILCTIITLTDICLNFPQSHPNLQGQIDKIPQNWPYLVLVTHDSTLQIFLVVEKEILLEPAGCWDAVKALFGAYFTYNMEYPKPCTPFFFQFYVLGINSLHAEGHLRAQIAIITCP